MKAPTICTWYGIKEAKRRQKKRFDFGGIYDDRFPIKNWINFTQFKKGFGGKERLFPPMLYQWHFPFKKPRPSTA
jgi:lipid II:glycine glycyltransferase (peptidoglycan interpeptide bridge formation enzyme)